MNEPVRILIVEDLETDIELAQHEIRRSVKDSIFQSVSTRKEFLKALETFKPDVILSDYSMPRFDGMKALELTLQHSPLTPFIIWTGSMSEEVAVECMKAGANNYVLKENIKRLGPTVAHALDERRQILERRIAEQKYQEIFENSPEGIFQSLPQGRYIKVNPAMARIYGYDSPQDMVESITNIGEQIYVNKSEREKLLQTLQARGIVEKFEQENFRKDGSVFWTSTSARAVRDDDGNILYFEGFLQDITDRKQAEIERQALFETMQGLAKTRDLGEFLKQLHASISKVIYAENIFVVYHQKDTGLFEEIYTVDRYDPPAEPSKLGKSISSYVFRTGEPIIMTRSLFEKLQASGEVELVGTHSQSWLGAPLKTPDGVIGVMAVQDYENPNRYSERDKDFLASIASQVAMVIEGMQTEKEEREQRSLAEALRDTAETLTNTLDFGEVLDQILAAVGKVVPHDAATIMLIEDGLAHVVRERGYKERGTNTQIMDVQLSLEDTANLKKMYHTGQPVVIPSTKTDPDWKVLPVTEWLKSNVGAPISIRDKVVGFILLDSETAGFYTPTHAERLKAFTNQAAVAIQNARLLQQAQDEIAERKQVEKKLRSSEGRHRALFENTPVAIWEEDFSELKKFLDNLKKEGITDFHAYFKSHPEELTKCAYLIRVLDVNNAALQMYEAQNKEALIKETVRVLTTGEQEHNREDFIAIAQGKTSNQWEGMDETLTGKPLEINLIWSVVPGYEEDFSRVIVTTVDVTALKQAERERAERLKEMTCLYAVRREMGMGLSLDELCERIIQHLSQAMQFPEVTAPMIEINGRVYASENYHEGLKNCINARITGQEGSSGRLYVYYTEDKSFILPEEQNLINSIADDLKLWLENWRAEEQLRSSEERFRQMAENIQEGFWLTDAVTGDEIYISPAIGKIWGRPVDDILDDPNAFVESILPEDREKVAKVIEQQRSGQPTVMEYRITRPDGTVRWIWDRAFPIFDESGRAIRVVGIAADITERKQAEQALHESEERYHGLFENSPVAIWEEDFSEVKKYIDLLKQQGIEDFREYFTSHPEDVTKCNRLIRVLHVNNTALKLFNAESKEVLLKHTDESTSMGEQENNIEDFIAIAEGRTSNSWAGSDSKLTGEPLQIELTWSVVPGHEKDYSRVIVTTMDITDRKRAEQEIKRSHSLLNAALEATKDGILVVGKDRRITSFNSKFLELWKIPYSMAQKGDDNSLLKFVLSQLKDPEKFISKVEDLYNTPEAESFDELEFEDGRVFERYSHPQRLGDEIVGRVWSFSDITERKQAEDELRARDLLLQEAQKLSRLGHYAFNISTGVWESSPTLNEIFGIDETYTLDVEGWSKIVHPAHRNDMIDYLNQHVLTEYQPFDREYRIVRMNDQEERWVHGLGQLEFDENGKPTRMIGTIQDITERKRTESEIKHHLTELEALYENGLAVGRLLKPKEIGDRIISTFERYLSWHHVTIRLLKDGGDELELVAYNVPRLNEGNSSETGGFKDLIHNVRQGMSGWVIQTGVPIRTGNVHAHSQYVDAYPGIHSGLYMPLKIGERVIGVISVESEKPDAFSAQDERLLATLANQAAIAFENARLYKSIEDERQRFMNLFENSPVATWLEDFSEVVDWMEGLREKGVKDLQTFLTENPEEVTRAVNRIRVLDVNHAAVLANAARSKQELMEQIHELLTDETPKKVMIKELEQIWKGFTAFEFEMSFKKLDGAIKHAIQRIFIPVTENGQVDYKNVILTSTDITDRVMMEQALRSSEAHYRELADSITDIFFELDHDMRYTHWNKAIETLTGIPAKDAIGKSIYDIFGKSREQERVTKIYEGVLAGHQPATFGTDLITKGEKRSFEINAYPSTRGVSVVAKDITERKRLEVLAQKRLELMEFSARHSLEEVMQRTMDEVCDLTGSAFGFFHFIEEDENTLGTQTWSTNTLNFFRVPVSAGTHLPVDQAGVWAEALRQRKPLIQNDVDSHPERKALPEGHPKIVREIVIPIIRNEKVVAVMGIANKERNYSKQDLDTTRQFADYAWDITERKRMEFALAEERDKLAIRVEERTADLIRANSNLARAIRVKDEFLANMSHELRTPLNAILGLSESLGEQIAGPLNEKQLKYITTISESGHHLLALINDILDLAKIEAGHLTLDINKVDVNSVCQASLRMVKQLAMNKNQNIEFQIEDGIGLMWADERRLKQMIVNLMSNAVKFTPDNKTIGLEVRGDRGENRIEISVWDNGIGIDRSELSRLFQPFVQLDSGLARESTGTGLGLTLVAQMARLHGGSVSVASEPNRGSRFTISLPWEPALAPDVVKKLKNTGQLGLSKSEAKARKTILIIEDTAEVIMMLKDYLESVGYNIATAQDGIDGIAEANLVQPDLILMDIQMPRMDGIETTKKLRSDPKFEHTPIIALTALAMTHDRERCIEAGMDEYISKPVNLRVLAKIIQSCLSPEKERTDRE